MRTLNCTAMSQEILKHLSNINCKPLREGVNNKISSAYSIHPKTIPQIWHPTFVFCNSSKNTLIKTWKIAGDKQDDVWFTLLSFDLSVVLHQRQQCDNFVFLWRIENKGQITGECKDGWLSSLFCFVANCSGMSGLFLWIVPTYVVWSNAGEEIISNYVSCWSKPVFHHSMTSREHLDWPLAQLLVDVRAIFTFYKSAEYRSSLYSWKLKLVQRITACK